MSAALGAKVRLARGSFSLDAALDVPAGGCLAVVGPNGAGKSTLLGAVAGTVAVDAATIELRDASGTRALDAPGRRPTPVPRRGVTLLEQRPLLFPHLDLADNVAFGPRSRGASRAEADAVASDWLRRIGLDSRSGERPHRLSGGQQQRVAIARALAARPDVLLLDEPFASLDASATPEVRALLAAELRRTETTSVLVTHQLTDAFSLADAVLVLEAGHVAERTTPRELSEHPRSRFGAHLAGFGVIEGVWESGGLRVGGALLPAEPDAASPPEKGLPAVGIVAPTDVEAVAGPAPGTVGTTVVGLEPSGGRVEVSTGCGLRAVLPSAVPPLPGERVWLAPRRLRAVGAPA